MISHKKFLVLLYVRKSESLYYIEAPARYWIICMYACYMSSFVT